MALNLTSALQKELESFKTPPAKELSPVPQVGSIAPSPDKLPLPRKTPVIIVFLRHCGCPFAEKTFKILTKLSSRNHSVHCIAVSHSSQAATDAWVVGVGGEWEVEVIVDEGRDLYAAWGLGLSSTWHALNPAVLYSAVALGRGEGIWNRATESGSRWQMGGAFAVDEKGVVRWARPARSADEIPDFQEALTALGSPTAAA